MRLRERGLKDSVGSTIAPSAFERMVRVCLDVTSARSLGGDAARAARVASPTAPGVQAMFHGTGVLERIEREVTPALGKAELKALIQSLRRLLAALE